MTKKLIMRLSNEMGNQMFMYASGYAFSKKLNREFFIDNETAFESRKNISRYGLSEFNFTAKIAPRSLKFLNVSGYLKRKIIKKLDKYKKIKSFYTEEKNKDKISSHDTDFLNNRYGQNLFLEGHFESEKYFYKYKDDIAKQFIFKNIDNYTNNPYYKMIKNSNSVSICIRQNRFSEKIRNVNSVDRRKSEIFTEEQINYVKKGVEIIKSKVNNPKFFLWSNRYIDLENYFSKDQFTMIINDNFISKDKKVILDLFLMTQAQNYIVTPSSYNWWGCWLSQNKNKIVLRPTEKNFSNFKFNNTDLWPEVWLKV